MADKLCEYEMDNMEAMGKGEIDKALSFHCKEISLIQVIAFRLKSTTKTNENTDLTKHFPSIAKRSL